MDNNRPMIQGDMTHLLAFDLGSSTGRALWGTYKDGQLSFEVIHSFPNGPIRLNGSWYWDILRIYDEMLVALRNAGQLAQGAPFTVGIDTWGVDCAFVDKTGQLMAPVHHYRDPRTEGLYSEIFQNVAREEIYSRTGIMFIQFNSLVQLFAEKKSRPWLLNQAEKLLFPPDLFTYFLTGQYFNEITIASTSQFLDPATRSWDRGLLECLEIPHHFLCPLISPGTIIGPLSPYVQAETGLGNEVTVVAVGGHDTASALSAAPTETSASAVISAGTWSLLGRELDSPERSSHSLNANFTNECSVGNKIFYHKILCGLWLIQECRRIWEEEGKELSYSEIHEAAEMAEPLQHIFYPDDPRFMNPLNMPDEIRGFFLDRGEDAPEGVAEMARSIYESLALNHAYVLQGIEKTLGTAIDVVHIVGGGSQAELLCQFTANASGKTVVAGPIEATALGNMLAQLKAQGLISGLEEGRRIVRNSLNLKVYKPRNMSFWVEALNVFMERL
ncbi:MULTISPECIES: rhamnulokinase [Aminobacterium]|jgi:rhamnulokinase|uniref:rhamnulokinase n=2 Tax=Aminobacterium TaxID=81466 RepID=UPI00257F3A9B|nr:rhamnulokinase family protein [Aminobacterium sp. UBA5514]